MPLVLYHGDARWSAATSFEALLDLEGEALESVLPHVPRFTFLLDDLTEISDQALWGRAMTAMATLTTLLFKHARRSPDLAERLGTWASGFSELLSAPSGLRAVEALLRYAFRVSDHVTPERVQEVLVAAVGNEIQEAVVTAGDRLIQQGFEKGIEQGVDRGRQQLVLKLLRLKFGALPDEVVACVEQGHGDELDRWGERILTAATLDDVFAG